MLNNEIIFYAGLPRSGSHLFSAILNQNPLLHSEGVSALCRILYDISQSINNPTTQEELKYFNRNNLEFEKGVSHSVINAYYENIKDSIVLDKNRSWTTRENIDFIKTVIKEDPKFIVMTRNIEEIVKSFVKIYILNGYTQCDAEKIILNFNEIGTNPFMRPVAATAWAKVVKNDKDFLFIDYDDLINDANETIKCFYKFIDKPLFHHDLNNINMKYKENVSLVGLIDVKKRIVKNKNEINLSEMAKEKIEYINYIFDLCENYPKNTNEIENFYHNNCG